MEGVTELPSLTAPCPLTSDHDCGQFFCGEPSLDIWLQKRALKNEVLGASRTYVVCSGNTVVAYYALAVGAIAHDIVPNVLKRNMPDPLPVMILGRLAVDSRYKGHAIGTALVRDALMRTLKAAEIAGMRALLVHALHEKAASFYRQLGFASSPFDAKILFLSLSSLRKGLLS